MNTPVIETNKGIKLMEVQEHLQMIDSMIIELNAVIDVLPSRIEIILRNVDTDISEGLQYEGPHDDTLSPLAIRLFKIRFEISIARIRLERIIARLAI